MLFFGFPEILILPVVAAWWIWILWLMVSLTKFLKRENKRVREDGN